MTNPSLNIDQHLAYLRDLSGPVREPDSSLPPFLRALLTADGTVTQLLRSFFGEVIDVATSGQSLFKVPASLELLRLDAGDQGFFRMVTLTGADSSQLYLSAKSILQPAALPSELFRSLVREDIGMGEVLCNSQRGTYRELVHIGCREGDEVERTYRVFVDGKPAILISERFVVSAFE